MNSPKRNGIDILTKNKIIDDIEAGEQRYNLKNSSNKTRILTIKNELNHIFYTSSLPFRKS